MKSIKSKSLSIMLLCLVFAILLPMQVQASQDVRLNKTKMSLIVGQKKTLKVKNTTEKVTWSSSENLVAKVSSEGVVTAKKAGTATITAMAGQKKYTCKVTVKEKPSLLKSKTICVGRKLKLNVKGTAKKVKWSSSNKAVVKVDRKGNIRGIKKGTATITAQVGSKKLNCKVKVKDAVDAPDKTVKVTDCAFVMVGHLSDSVSCKIADSKIAEIAVTASEKAEYGPGRESAIVIYAKKSGTSYVTVSNDCNNKKVRFKINVKKTSPVTAKDKVKAYVIGQGMTDEECNKVISKSFAQQSAKATITFDFWGKDIAYEYEETKDGTEVNWTVLGAEDPKSGMYIVMWIKQKGEAESQYITAEFDPASYKGEALVYEEGWYKIAAEEQLQTIANEVTPRAYQAMDELLAPVGVKFGENF